jgi:hypothetical protein
MEAGDGAIVCDGRSPALDATTLVMPGHPS